MPSCFLRRVSFLTRAGWKCFSFLLFSGGREKEFHFAGVWSSMVFFWLWNCLLFRDSVFDVEF